MLDGRTNSSRIRYTSSCSIEALCRLLPACINRPRSSSSCANAAASLRAPRPLDVWPAHAASARHASHTGQRCRRQAPHQTRSVCAAGSAQHLAHAAEAMSPARARVPRGVSARAGVACGTVAHCGTRPGALLTGRPAIGQRRGVAGAAPVAAHLPFWVLHQGGEIRKRHVATARHWGACALGHDGTQRAGGARRSTAATGDARILRSGRADTRSAAVSATTGGGRVDGRRCQQRHDSSVEGCHKRRRRRRRAHRRACRTRRGHRRHARLEDP